MLRTPLPPLDPFEEEIIRRRLVIEGGGRAIDMMKINQLSKNYIAWVRHDGGSGSGQGTKEDGNVGATSTSSVPKTPDELPVEETALESRVLRMVGRVRGDMVRAIQAFRVMNESMEEYKKVQDDIKDAIKGTKQYLEENRSFFPNSQEQFRKKMKEQQIEALSEVLGSQDWRREELEAKKNERAKELGKLKDTEKAMDNKMKCLAEKVAVMLACAEINDEKYF